MKYTEQVYYDNVCVTRVTPTDEVIVRFALTARVKGYLTRSSESALNLFAALALSGTKRRSKEALEDYLKRNGIALEIKAGRGDVTLVGHVRSKNLSYAVAIIQEILLEPRIAKNEFNEKKKLAREHNREEHDNAKRIAYTHFIRSLFTKDSFIYAQTLEEELKDITTVTQKALETLTHALIESEWFLTVVGNQSSEKTFLPLIHRLAHGAQHVPRGITSTVPHAQKNSFTPVMGKANIEVFLGKTVPLTMKDADFIPLEFGMNVLGKIGGFSGRLMSTVREKEGLTYGIYAHLATPNFGHTTHWSIKTFFTAADYAKGLASTKRELTNIVEKGITQKELKTFKEILANAAILAHDSSTLRLAQYHGLARAGYTETDYEDMLNRIHTLTVREVNAALKNYIHPQTFVLSAAGPIDTQGKPLITATT